MHPFVLGRKQTHSSLLMAHDGSALIDIGGGNGKDSRRHALSNIPLHWMVREILNSGCRIHFDPTALKLWDIPFEMIEQRSMVREASSATYFEDTPWENTMLDEDEYCDAPGKEKAGFATYGKSVTGGLSLAAEESLDSGDAVMKLRDELKKGVLMDPRDLPDVVQVAGRTRLLDREVWVSTSSYIIAT